jgi:hypothetical protein
MVRQGQTAGGEEGLQHSTCHVQLIDPEIHEIEGGSLEREIDEGFFQERHIDGTKAREAWEEWAELKSHESSEGDVRQLHEAMLRGTNREANLQSPER